MFERLLISRMAGALAAHSAERQSVLARNVANADTPRYQARDVQPFAEIVEDAGFALRRTHARHVASSGLSAPESVIRAGAETSPNGNTVSLEREMVASAEVRQNHNMALSIYSTMSSILRTSLGRNG